MEINYRKQALLQKYLDGKCSRAELEELFDYLKSDDDEAYQPIMEDLWKEIGAEKILQAEKADYLLQQTTQRDKPVALPSRKWYRYAAAAVLALVVGLGVVYVFLDNREPVQPVVQNIIKKDQNDVKPGSVKAFLQAGSVQVALNKKDTSFALAGNMVKVNNGNLEVTNAKTAQYTLIVPRGGEYNLVLSDGTKVWLNADSKLVYPSKFTGEKRAVTLEGEAYFNVAKNAGHPFIVHTQKQDIQVLGTEFNVHAYSNENEFVTTLVNGVVRVNSFGQKMVLEPGQQVISVDGQATLQEHPDIKQAVAWKEGLFQFSGDNIGVIMREIARWYDVEVVYTNGIPMGHITGKIPRNTRLSKVLEIMQLSGIHFKIEGKKVIVLTS